MTQRPPVLRKVVGWIAYIVAFSVAFVLVKGLVSQANTPTKRELDAATEEGLKWAEAQIIPTLPKRVNEYTTLIGVSHSGLTIIYTYKLGHIRRDTDAVPDYLGKNKALVAERACKTQETRANLDNDVTMKYVYEDLQGALVGSFDVTKRDC
jgi:hypothetical protein